MLGESERQLSLEVIGKAAGPMGSVLKQIEDFMYNMNRTRKEMDREYKELEENEEMLLNISEQMPLVLSRTRIAKTQVEQQASIDETFNQQLLQELESAAGQYFLANRTALVAVIEAAAEHFDTDPVGTWLRFF